MVEEKPEYSVVVPCFNEGSAIGETVRGLFPQPGTRGSHEVIVVDDGSTDESPGILEELAAQYPGLCVLQHGRNRGYGAALKTGISQARADLVVITDADGTYPNERIPELVDTCRRYDMVVGARVGEDVQYSKVRKIPKLFLSRWVSWLCGQQVPDINSGLRVLRKDTVEKFIRILPDTFSFTTTITVAMLTNLHRVKFVPISYQQRIGKSKIKPIRDTLRFMALILRTATYFAPFRVFAPFALALGLLALGSLFYDVFVVENLTDKTVLLFLFSFNTGMFALLADMIDKRTGR